MKINQTDRVKMNYYDVTDEDFDNGNNSVFVDEDNDEVKIYDNNSMDLVDLRKF